MLATRMRMTLDRGEHDLPSLIYRFDLCRYERAPDGGMDVRTQVRLVPRLAHGNAYVFVAYSAHSRQEFPERTVHGVEAGPATDCTPISAGWTTTPILVHSGVRDPGRAVRAVRAMRISPV